ncbi:MAG: SH3 domain-containing protein [Chloroflexota bacterium]|nr:SH3 domain-containing protein [Chloroflexota bacterium]
MDRTSFHTTADTVANTLGKTVNRRSLVKSIAGIGGAAVLVPTLGLLSPAAARSTDSLIVNTAGARLRSGPGTGYGVIASLAKGTEVRYLADGGTANGYRWYKVRVLATGKEGFMSASLLSAPDAGPGGDPVIVGSAKTTAAVNLRSGPSTGNQVLRVVPKGAVVKASNTYRNGFRYVIYEGLAGWVADQYLSSDGSQPGEGTFTTTARLNLRAAPNTTAAVKLVIPSGATVKALAGRANGWREVSYKGASGWAATSYLN